MELTTEQKVAIFDWVAEKVVGGWMVSCEFSPDTGCCVVMVCEDYLSDAYKYAVGETPEEAFYNAYRKDTGNE